MTFTTFGWVDDFSQSWTHLQCLAKSVPALSACDNIEMPFPKFEISNIPKVNNMYL